MLRKVLTIIVFIFMVSSVQAETVSVDYNNAYITDILFSLKKSLNNIDVLYYDGHQYTRDPLKTDKKITVKYAGELPEFLRLISRLSDLDITYADNSIVVKDPIQAIVSAAHSPDTFSVNFSNVTPKYIFIKSNSIYFVGEDFSIDGKTYHAETKDKIIDRATAKPILMEQFRSNAPDSLLTQLKKSITITVNNYTYTSQIDIGKITFTKLVNSNDYLKVFSRLGEKMNVQCGPFTFVRQLHIGNEYLYGFTVPHPFSLKIFPTCKNVADEENILLCEQKIDIATLQQIFNNGIDVTNIVVCDDVEKNCNTAPKATLYGDFNREWRLAETVDRVGFVNKKEVRTYEDDKKAEKVNVDITAYEQPLNVVLVTLLAGTDYTYLIKDGADGSVPVSITTKKASLTNTLNEITSQAGFFWKREGNTFVIYRDVDRTFTIGFPQIMQSFDISSSQSRTSDSGSTTGATTGGNNTGGNNTSGGGASSSSLVTAKAAGKKENMAALESTLKSFVSPTGKITFFKEMGMVYVHDRKNAVEQMEKFITGLNAELKKTLKIKGIITEVALTNNSQFGIDWSYVLNDVIKSATNSDISIGVSTAKLVANSVFALDSTFKWNSNTEKVYINALKEYGDVKIVSKPFISVANGSVGSLTVGDTINYIAQAYVSNTGGLAGTQTSTMVVSPLQVGLNFFVMPQILSDTEAILYISPDLTNLQEIRTITNNNITVEAPHTTVKQTQTIINVKNGQKLLIGGIISESNTKTKTGVPVLMDVPVLGSIFKGNRKDTSSSEFALMLDVSW